jgi:hypothetical protein
MMDGWMDEWNGSLVSQWWMDGLIIGWMGEWNNGWMITFLDIYIYI